MGAVVHLLYSATVVIGFHKGEDDWVRLGNLLQKQGNVNFTTWGAQSSLLKAHRGSLVYLVHWFVSYIWSISLIGLKEDQTKRPRIILSK